MDPTKRKTIIAGNWKMNITPKETPDLIGRIRKWIAPVSAQKLHLKWCQHQLRIIHVILSLKHQINDCLLREVFGADEKISICVRCHWHPSVGIRTLK